MIRIATIYIIGLVDYRWIRVIYETYQYDYIVLNFKCTDRKDLE